MWLYGQAIVNGLLVGGVYALLAVGLTMIYGLRIINFAYGDMLMWALYLSYFLAVATGTVPYWVVLAATPIMFVFGYFVFRLWIERSLGGSASNQILLTAGIAMILQNLALLLFSSTTHKLSLEFARKSIELPGGLLVDYPRAIAFGGSLIIGIGLYYFLFRTRSGRWIRAAADNRTGAGLCGVPVPKVYALAFALATSTLGAAAPLIIPFLYVTPSVGLSYTLTLFIIVVLGGIGSFAGAILGSLMIGVLQSLGAVLLPGTLSELVVYLLFFVVLLLRPKGLLPVNR